MFRYISGANGNSGDDALLSDDGGINVRSLPEDVQAVFADIDANGDGVLDMEEFKTMLSTYAVLRRSNQEGSVSISTLPDKVQPALKVFDQDGDGTVDPKELMRAAEMYQASKKSQKRMRKFIIGLVLFVVALIGINSAMTFMMVELGKETKASPDGVMRVNAGGGQHGAPASRVAPLCRRVRVSFCRHELFIVLLLLLGKQSANSATRAQSNINIIFLPNVYCFNFSIHSKILE